jgi:hypothetical protein
MPLRSRKYRRRIADFGSAPAGEACLDFPPQRHNRTGVSAEVGASSIHAVFPEPSGVFEFGGAAEFAGGERGAEGPGVEVGQEAGRFRVVAGAAGGVAHGRGDGQHCGFE